MSDSKSSPKCTPPARRVRSFVKRQGRLTTGQRRALDACWPQFGVDFLAAPLDLEQLFGRRAPVTLEIGFGSGDNLLAMATARPEHDFIGIEVHEPGVGHCLLGIEAAGLTNIRLICHDAVEVMRDMLPAGALSRVNLFFPDPWPKKRHHKRRIVQPDFVARIAALLQADGVLHVATDWPNYAEHIDAMLSTAPEFTPLPTPPADRTVSRFDARGQKLGHANWERAWRLAPSGSANQQQ